MASNKKKIVTKDDLRRLMKEKQSVIKHKSNRIDHPLAKYNSLDQLVCVLCNTVIKSDIVWTAHLVSRQHKEKLAAVKTNTPDSVGVKRKTDIIDTGPSKKKKDNSNGSNTQLPSDFFESGSSTGAKPPKSILTNSSKPLLSQYESSESEEETVSPAPAKPQTSLSAMPASLKSTKSSLPSDFFDTGVMPSASAPDPMDTDEKPSTSMASALPEGFFDDPKMDAKVRKVEYVDKKEEEWELFQKSMKEETYVSEAIMEEEDEQVNVARNIDEIDEQIQCWKEVNDLENKKEEIMKNKVPEMKTEAAEEDDLDDEQLEDFLDWRSKKSWR